MGKKKAKTKEFSRSKIEVISLDKLKEDGNNARIHDTQNIETIKNNLKEFGQYAPLLVKKANHTVIVGNGRLQAMRELGWKECECILMDLDNIKAIQLAIADNRSSELADWDDTLLAEQLRLVSEEKIDCDLLGFDKNNIDILQNVSNTKDDFLLNYKEPEQKELDEIEKKLAKNKMKSFVLVYYSENEKLFWINKLGIKKNSTKDLFKPKDLGFSDENI